MEMLKKYLIESTKNGKETTKNVKESTKNVKNDGMKHIKLHGSMEI